MRWFLQCRLACAIFACNMVGTIPCDFFSLNLHRIPSGFIKYPKKYLSKNIYWTTEIAQWPRVFIAPLEDWCLVLSTHMAAQRHLCFFSRVIQCSLLVFKGTDGMHIMYIHTCRQTFTHIISFFKSLYLYEDGCFGHHGTHVEFGGQRSVFRSLSWHLSSRDP